MTGSIIQATGMVEFEDGPRLENQSKVRNNLQRPQGYLSACVTIILSSKHRDRVFFMTKDKETGKTPKFPKLKKNYLQTRRKKVSKIDYLSDPNSYRITF